MDGGLCYFHSNPDKAAELGRNGGRRRKQTYEQVTRDIAPPESAADVRRMLAEVKAGKMDPKVANTVAYLATVLLRAYEAAATPSADTSAQAYVPLIYRSLISRDGRKHEPDDVIDLETGERVALPAPEAPRALPACLEGNGQLAISAQGKGEVCLGRPTQACSAWVGLGWAPNQAVARRGVRGGNHHNLFKIRSITRVCVTLLAEPGCYHGYLVGLRVRR